LIILVEVSLICLKSYFCATLANSIRGPVTVAAEDVAGSKATAASNATASKLATLNTKVH
jgi:hypothetical protein